MNPKDNPVKIIGMGMSKKNLPAAYLWKISKADILVGGRRHLEQFESHKGQKYAIDKDLAGLVQFIKDHMASHNIVVIASGDPLFYGIGGFLIKSLGAENVEIFTNISAVATAFAKIKEPWQDARVVSLHGRDTELTLLKALNGKATVAVYTDAEKTPAWIANLLLAHDLTGFNACVLECLDTPLEKIDWYSLDQASKTSFQSPNILILKPNRLIAATHRQVYVGSPEAWFDHQDGLITKAEVRAVSLSKLRLEPNHIMWDLGAGSGSVGIEASVFVTRGRIFAVEKNLARVAQIRTNLSRFGVHNLTVLTRNLPEGLGDLPAPDRVFLGGGGQRLKPILQAVTRSLKPNGIIVVNTVLLESMQMVLSCLKEIGYTPELVQLQVNRGHMMAPGDRLDALNPVWIISGQRPNEYIA